MKESIKMNLNSLKKLALACLGSLLFVYMMQASNAIGVWIGAEFSKVEKKAIDNYFIKVCCSEKSAMELINEDKETDKGMISQTKKALK